MLSQKAMVRPSATSKMLLLKCAQKHYCFSLDWCAHVISLTKESMSEHNLAKALFPKAALLDWCAPGLSLFIITPNPLS